MTKTTRDSTVETHAGPSRSARPTAGLRVATGLRAGVQSPKDPQSGLATGR